MNAKISVFVISVKPIIYLFSYHLRDYTFNISYDRYLFADQNTCIFAIELYRNCDASRTNCSTTIEEKNYS